MTSAVQGLEARLRGLVWARRRQVSVQYALTGLSIGLLAGSVLILGAGVASPEYSAWPLFAVLVGGAVGIALAFACFKWPDRAAVTLDVDRILGLKEQLSTALEFSGRPPAPTEAVEAKGEELDPILVERLARRAARARVPVRPTRIFPIRLNTWARLIPVAGALVLVAALVELPHLTATDETPLGDPEVIAAGVELEDYGVAMAARARRNQMTRATEQAAAIEELGGQMRHGGLARPEALARLRQVGEELNRQSMKALSEGSQTQVGAVSFESLSRPEQHQAQSLRELLNRVLPGRLSADEAMRMGGEDLPLDGAGISWDRLEQALREHAEGDSKALMEVLRDLPERARSSPEAKELLDARRAVDQARRRLGDTNADQSSDADPFGQAGDLRGPDNESGEWDADENSNAGEIGGSGQSRGNAAGPEAGSADGASAPGNQGAVVKPDGQIGAGGVYSGEARVLPRGNESAVVPVDVTTDYAARVEEVMSKEVIPDRHKDFVRRYFLGVGDAGLPGESTARPEDRQ